MELFLASAGFSLGYRTEDLVSVHCRFREVLTLLYLREESTADRVSNTGYSIIGLTSYARHRARIPESSK